MCTIRTGYKNVVVCKKTKNRFFFFYKTTRVNSTSSERKTKIKITLETDFMHLESNQLAGSLRKQSVAFYYKSTKKYKNKPKTVP